MATTWWSDLGIICGSILAAIALLGYAARGFRRMWHTLSKFNRLLDQALGEPARDGQPARPGLMEQVATTAGEVAAIKVRLDQHLKWHGGDEQPPPRSGPLPLKPGERGTVRWPDTRG